MTYCLAVKLNEGLIMMSDTRTNAGVDNISRFRKMFTWSVPGERAIMACTAGNLSITQGVLTRINAAISQAANAEDPNAETILNAPTMYRIAQIFGEEMREMQDLHRKSLQEQGAGAGASILVAGQRKGGAHRLFLVYSAGNFIEATEDTPYFQIGEHKYGKPILDRIITPATPMPVALKTAFLSMDSTLRSNLSVGMPLDLSVIKKGAYQFDVQRRIDAEDEDYAAIANGWAAAIRTAFEELPDVGIGLSTDES